MTDIFNDDISKQIDLKLNIHRNTLDKKVNSNACHESATRPKIDKCLKCMLPVQCEQCEHFINNECFKGKKKPL